MERTQRMKGIALVTVAYMAVFLFGARMVHAQVTETPEPTATNTPQATPTFTPTPVIEAPGHPWDGELTYAHFFMVAVLILAALQPKALGMSIVSAIYIMENKHNEVALQLFIVFYVAAYVLATFRE